MILIDRSFTGPYVCVYQVRIHLVSVTVTVTSNPYIVDRWIRNTYHIHPRAAPCIGLGVQYTIRDDNNDVGLRPAETLEICIGHRCLIFQLNQAQDVPFSLREFLMDERNLFVGFYNSWHRMELLICRHQLSLFRDPLNMRFFAVNRDGWALDCAPLELIAQECLGLPGIRMLTDVILSDWSVQNLGFEQVLQVTLSAFCAMHFAMTLQLWKLVQ